MERVITIGLQTGRQREEDARSSLAELERLVDSAGGRVVESHLQRRGRPDAALWIGSGKAAQVRERARALGVTTVVLDDDLRPGQQRPLEAALDAKVVDRTRLILDIFARRARTREGILQVELAQMQYLLPRVTARFGRFEQQVGGIGTRGPGERKLEVDRRRIRDRIALLGRQIEKVRRERELQRSVRRGVPVPQVALVGYTNAGKSTLLNALRRAAPPPAGAHAGGEVYADDKLFATLDPITRRVRLPSGRVILFTDTVGFIRRLPTELVAAFRATLEESLSADLLAIIVDAADPAWEEQEALVHRVLRELRADPLPQLTAYNKIDRLSPSQVSAFRRRGGVLCSARAGGGIRDFLGAVEKALTAQWVQKTITIPYAEGRRLARLHEWMEVLEQEPMETGYRVTLRSHPATLAQLGKESE